MVGTRSSKRYTPRIFSPILDKSNQSVANCAQQAPDATYIDIGGQLTATDVGTSRGSLTSIDSLDEILKNLADVMATESNRNDQQEQLSSSSHNVNYSNDSVSFGQPSQQPGYEQSGGKQ